MGKALSGELACPRTGFVNSSECLRYVCLKNRAVKPYFSNQHTNMSEPIKAGVILSRRYTDTQVYSMGRRGDGVCLHEMSGEKLLKK